MQVYSTFTTLKWVQYCSGISNIKVKQRTESVEVVLQMRNKGERVKLILIYSREALGK